MTVRRLLLLLLVQSFICRAFPESYHSCSPAMVQGYFSGKSVRCTCSLTPDGSETPTDTAQWYMGDTVQITDSDGSLALNYDSNAPAQVYTCEDVSDSDRKVGSTLTAKFAFLDPDSVKIASLATTQILCDSNDKVLVTCRVPTEKVNPAPTFSASLDGLSFDGPQSASVTGAYYQGQSYLDPGVGGEYQVTCRMTNTVLNSWQEAQTKVNVIEPPSLPPQVTVEGLAQVYQGVDQANTITLPEGYIGDVTCRVEGGYPGAENTQLKCGDLEGPVGRWTSTLTFTAANPVSSEMNGTVCVCTSQHDSGCYSNNETTLALNVIYLTFTHNPPKRDTLREGSSLALKCSITGNPDPTSLTLTRNRTNKVLKKSQTAELTYAVDDLSCLDTGVYVCSTQKSHWTVRKDVSVEVHCPQQFSPTFDLTHAVDVATGENAHVGIEIYGFPEPKTLILLRMLDSKDLTSSVRHSVRYTASEAPFGFVNVTFSDLLDADLTNYTLIVDNGEGAALTYTFYLNEVKSNTVHHRTGGSGASNGVAISVGVTVTALVIVVVVVAIVMVLRKRGLSKASANEPKNPNQYINVIYTQPSSRNVNSDSNSASPYIDPYEVIDESEESQGGTVSGACQYYTVEDLPVAPNTGRYNSLSPQDVEPPSIYNHPRPTPPTGDHERRSGVYNNIAVDSPGQDGTNAGQTERTTGQIADKSGQDSTNTGQTERATGENIDSSGQEVRNAVQKEQTTGQTEEASSQSKRRLGYSNVKQDQTDGTLTEIEGSQGQSEDSQVQTEGSQGQTEGSQGQTEGLKVQTEGSQGQTEGLKVQTEESQVQTEGSKGQAEGLQGQTEGSQVRTEGSKSQAEGSQGQTEGSRGQTEGSQGQTEGSQGRTEGLKVQTEESQVQTAGSKSQTEESQVLTEGLQGQNEGS